MKTSLNLRLIALVLFMSQNVLSQTHIASSNHSLATVNSNQRKIVRDYDENAYIVYTDIISDTIRIFGLVYDNENNSWTTATQITHGQSPTLAIGIDDRIHMVYESNNYPDQRIMYLYTEDFLSWSDPVELSNTQFNCRYPVADVDSVGVLNVLWIEDSYSFDQLNYRGIVNDSLTEIKEVLTKQHIYEITIANHLQYILNDMFFGVSYYSDTIELNLIQFFRSTDHLYSFSSIYIAEGVGSPCISFNSIFESSEAGLVRLLYGNSSLGITEIELFYPDYSFAIEQELPYNAIQFLSIDNLAPPIGYSFLFVQNEELKHGFSYGSEWNWSTILSAYQSTNNILRPSIAYKHFNPLYVDFIWMEEIGINEYNIYYKREDKHVWMPGIEDNEVGKGFSITGSPNPFKDQIIINVLVEEELIPSIKIYNVSSQMIKELSFTKDSDRDFKFVWNGKQADGNIAEDGIYIVMCSVGDKQTARKIIYQP